MTLTRRQHYVWRKYLRPWSANEKIWCLRDGKIFQSNLMGVAQERDFYRLTDLSAEEVRFLENFCNNQKEPLRTANRRWIKYFTAIFELQKRLMAQCVSSEALEKAMHEASIELEDSLHGRIEQEAVKYLDSLLRGDARLLQDPHDKSNFFYFLCVQYTRTKKLKANALKLHDPQRISVSNVWNTLSHIISTSLGHNLIAYGYQLYFLKPGGQCTFITGDQPVVNVHSSYLPNTQTPTDLDLYYPISPQLAVLVASHPPNESILSDTEVGTYNDHMRVQSYEFVFADGRAALEALD